jgi:hypothetical protein
MSLYELAILGSPTVAERDALLSTLGNMIDEFGLVVGRDVIVHDAATIGGRDNRAAFSAVYFGAGALQDAEIARSLLEVSAPVIPTISERGDFKSEVPEFLQSTNGLVRRTDDRDLSELATSALECVGLLRRQRRVFISYRRVESRSAALQLHDLLSARGFDVFLDTHGIKVGDPFQEVLWHRLVDADVLLMLDTPTYFDSRWTRQEIGRARAKDIHVLRVVWPGHSPSKLTDLAETIYLEAGNLDGPDGPIAQDVADIIVLRLERLRSRSIAARYLSITGKLRADVAKIGASVEGIGAHRAIAVKLLDDRRIWVYPIVGIPTAELLNDIADKAKRAAQREVPVLVYDHVGIREAWAAHLTWLDEQISAVRAIKVSEAGWALAAWEA